jgi:UDP-N-acetylglucosamine enolpyruvyl transferase
MMSKHGNPRSHYSPTEMSGCGPRVAGLVARGETVVDGAESIPVSYPGFVGDMRGLGAQVKVE